MAKSTPKASEEERRRLTEYQRFKGDIGGEKIGAGEAFQKMIHTQCKREFVLKAEELKNCNAMQNPSPEHGNEQGSMKCMSQVKFRSGLGNPP